MHRADDVIVSNGGEFLAKIDCVWGVELILNRDIEKKIKSDKTCWHYQFVNKLFLLVYTGQ